MLSCRDVQIDPDAAINEDIMPQQSMRTSLTRRSFLRFVALVPWLASPASARMTSAEGFRAGLSRAGEHLG